MSNIIGIDLGTTYSAVAVIDEVGIPKLIENQSKTRRDNLIPSVVTIKKDGEVEVGESPRRSLELDENTVGRWKRDMGKSKKFKLQGKNYTPTDFSSLVLSEIKDIAEENYGKVDKAVVTIPANFSSNAREATLEAALKAGLNVERIINEPTAAALYCAYVEGSDFNGKYAVFDLGGGTFDISIIKVKGKDIEVLGSDGIHELGGQDFDIILQQIVSNKFKKKTKEALEKEDYTVTNAEEDKKLLSTDTEILIRVMGKTIKIERNEFEEAISSKVVQAEMKCESLMDELKLSSKDIVGVILAGGSTRIPCVQECVKRVFKQDPISIGNPDEMVALGAALHAAYTSDEALLNAAQQHTVKNISIQERTADYYGTIVAALSAGNEYILEVSNIINRGEKIPVSVTKEYYTLHEGQTAVNCKITESKTNETDPKWVYLKWDGQLDLPSNCPEGDLIKVTYSYDENQVMNCSFVHDSSGRKTEIALNISALDDDVEKFTVD